MLAVCSCRCAVVCVGRLLLDKCPVVGAFHGARILQLFTFHPWRSCAGYRCEELCSPSMWVERYLYSFSSRPRTRLNFGSISVPKYFELH